MYLYISFLSTDQSLCLGHRIVSDLGGRRRQWRYSMYATSLFHSNTHEVLCITSGSAKLCFGGEENPGRVEPVVNSGDVIVLPAGMAHRLLHDMSTASRFEMVGSYPRGYDWDMCYGEEGGEGRVKGIGEVPWFVKDPIYGEHGPVLED